MKIKATINKQKIVFEVTERELIELKRFSDQVGVSLPRAKQACMIYLFKELDGKQSTDFIEGIRLLSEKYKIPLSKVKSIYAAKTAEQDGLTQMDLTDYC